MVFISGPILGKNGAVQWEETVLDTIRAYWDLETGILWTHEEHTAFNKTFDNLSDTAHQNRGCIEYCQGLGSQGWETPSLKDFLIAYQHGLSNIIKDANQAYWTSTERETSPEYYAYFIALNDGTTGWSPKRNRGGCRCAYKKNE
ncbi:MAG: hypothetical protein HYY61_02995 [Deltaproteobacteria bacterium]|nr:hypothetical protein [Deltaproteobacteria bacterium]